MHGYRYRGTGFHGIFPTYMYVYIISAMISLPSSVPRPPPSSLLRFSGTIGATGPLTKLFGRGGTREHHKMDLYLELRASVNEKRNKQWGIKSPSSCIFWQLVPMHACFIHNYITCKQQMGIVSIMQLRFHVCVNIISVTSHYFGRW